jgi:hypothetical protein
MSNIFIQFHSECLRSRSGEILWQREHPNPQGRLPKKHILRGKAGISAYAANRITDNPTTAFYLIFDKATIESIRQHTNKEGQRVMKENFE